MRYLVDFIDLVEQNSAMLRSSIDIQGDEDQFLLPYPIEYSAIGQ